jgi:tRNA (guanine37-N1)-methyltransferase
MSFLETSLVKKAKEKGIITHSLVNPRDFCEDKHKQVDDEIYGWWAGMLMKAQPIIDSIESIVNREKGIGTGRWKIVFLSPSKAVRNQQLAYEYSDLDHIIFVSGRYEWIDHRFEEYMQKRYPDNFVKISLGQFVTLWGEIPSMVVVESIVRLIPWVIKEEASHLIESYDPQQSMQNIEYPQYTRPEEVEWIRVPDVLLSGHHAEIEKRRQENNVKM